MAAPLRREGSVPKREMTAEDRERRRQASAVGEPAPAAGVKVVCRLRPMNERERKTGTVPAATASTERREVAVVRVLGGTRKVSSNFHFDDVLTSFSTQSEVFQSTLEPLIHEVLAGYEATAFAYGQTGTGKTYTMEGDVESDEGRGLVPRAAAAVIDALAGGKYTEYAVTVSYLEIYNEELSDLLAPPHLQQQKLDLKDSGGGRGVCCQGLSEVPVASVQDILELVFRAQERRRVAETRINARSSRSHSIFTMKVRCRKTLATGELENVGKLHLVDLAGSECAKKAGPAPEATGTPAAVVRPAALAAGAAEEERERKNINQSLLTLGRVITALRDGSGRIPYRDSKLTRILQDSLGGRCKTVIIATISPALGAVEETISTLTYAEQASGIQNRPVASSLLRTLRYTPGGEAKSGEGSGGQGNCDFAELEMKVAYLSQEVEEAQAALARNYREAQVQAERAQAAEERLAETEEQLETAKLTIEESNFVCAKLSGFGAHQSEVAEQFAGALGAATAHGEALEGRLNEGREKMLSSRRQALELFGAVEVETAAVSQASSERATEAAKALGETHAAHATATEAAREASKEQRRLLSELLAVSNEVSSRLGEQLGGLSAEARKALDDELKSSADSIDTIEAAAGQVATAAGRLKAETAASTAQDGEALGKQAESIQEELGAGREALSASATRLVEDIAASRETAKTGHEQACKRLRGTLQEPLATHGTSLSTAAQLAGAHAAAATALAAAGAEDAQQADRRRRSLLDALAAASASHGKATAERPAALGRAHEALREALGTHSKAVEESLSSLSTRLGATTRELEETTQRGRSALSSAIEGADAKLGAAWQEEASRLEGLQATLSSALEAQREGHAAEAVQALAAEAAQALTTSLAAAVGELALARENIAGQVAELEQQRSAEQEVLELLRQQREALQADVAGERATLEEVRRELEGARGEVRALKEAQERRRAQALEAITTAVAAELGALGEALSSGAAAVEGRLGAAGTRAGEVEEAAIAAEERNSKLGLDVAATAGAWSQASSRSCGAIAAAQARAREAAEAVGRASEAGEAALGGLGLRGAKWGEACDRVSGLLADCSQQRAGLASSLEALRPEWQASREEAKEATRAWAEGGGHVKDGLVRLATDASAAGKELDGLRAGVAERCGGAERAAEDWRAEAGAHGATLSELQRLGEDMAKEASQAEKRRAEENESRGREAEDLSLRAGQAVSEASALAEAAAAHAEVLPVDFAASDAAMASAAAAVEDLSGKAGVTLSSGAKGVGKLAAAQAVAAQVVCAAVATQADKAASAAKLGGTVAAHYRKASAASLESLRQQWRRGDEAREASLAALRGAAEASGAASQTALEASGERLKKEFSSGEAAKELAGSALRSLSSETSESLARLRDGLRKGLGERPLEAFEEELDRAPRWPEAAAWPQIKALPRPAEEELALEFQRQRAGRVEAEFNDAENLVGPPQSRPGRSGGDKKVLAKEAWGAQGPGDAAGPLPRRALAEIN